MQRVDEIFQLSLSKDLMSASLELKEISNPLTINVTKGEIVAYLKNHNIIYGLLDSEIEKIVDGIQPHEFPIIVAKGLPQKHGKNGQIHYSDVKTTNLVNKNQKRNFRDVMIIPSVQTGDQIAHITPPTNGTEGMDICGNIIQATPGKPISIKPGKNVSYNKKNRVFEATQNGQLSIKHNRIHVYPSYEVHGDLDMKTGNIDFVGSVTIHGNIPTGYSITAAGDVTIEGLVEAASITAGGSIYISEGFVGLGKGKLIAGQDIKVNDINQGTVEADGNLYVGKSIIHSHCIAKKSIYCQNGNIIGGIVSAGKRIEAKNIGNKLGTKTLIAIGINKKAQQMEQQLIQEKKELIETEQKLVKLGDQLIKKHALSGLNQKEKLLLIKQQRSIRVTKKQLEEKQEDLVNLKMIMSNQEDLHLVVKGTIYPNVELSLHKYRKYIHTVYHYVKAILDNQEITIHSL
ncbi:FapA family protein [Aquibacillus sediminis]|uniref:FapA family protein n=1 Tax=Aquibacillus sediminis TaxID=2574734 RepID=UPI0011086FB3|nr:FapA family protein [Aquibacillus sediminis]